MLENFDISEANCPDEREMLTRLKSGDHRAFEEIYHKYKDKLISNMLRILRSPELVEEQVQELFLRIWKGRETIDLDKPFKAYLFRIAANMAKNIFRKMAYDKQMRSTLLPIEKQIYTHVEEQVSLVESKRILDDILNALPPQRKVVYTLCKLEGMSYREVAELLNISENTVNDHIRKANFKLRKLKVNMDSISFVFIVCSSI